MRAGIARPTSEIVAELRAKASEIDARFGDASDTFEEIDDGEVVDTIGLTERTRLRVAVGTRNGVPVVTMRVLAQNYAGAWHASRSRSVSIASWRLGAVARVLASAIELTASRLRHRHASKHANDQHCSNDPTNGDTNAR